jgi:serine protease Do
MIAFRCPRCKKALQMPEDRAGTKLACPGCGQRLQVPDPGFDKTMPAHLIQELVASASAPARQPQPASPPAPAPASAPWQGAAPPPRRSRTGGVVLLLAAVAVGVGGALGWAGLKGRLPAANLTPQQIVAKHAPSVALVGTRWGNGTGFLVRPGVLATNAHVIDGAPLDQFRIYFPSAGEAGKTGKPARQLLYKDSKRDLALLAVDSDLPPVPVADHYKFQSGQTVTVIGNPGLGGVKVLENTVSTGILGTQADLGGLTFYQLSISINPGNSGGPVFDSAGRVVGVVTLKAKKEEGIAFGVPAADLQDAIQKALDAPKGTAEKVTARHNLEVVFRGVARAGNLYTEAMDIYTQKIREAQKNGKQAAEGLREAKQIDNKLKQLEGNLLAPVQPALKAVTSDEQLPEATRGKLTDLWTVYTEMKEQIDNPRGTVQTFLDRTGELKGRHKKLVESLKLMTGVDDLE